jgi:hypothetical protein
MLAQQKEALAQINLMQQIIQGNTKLLFSGRKTIAIGIILCLVPVFELAFNHLPDSLNPWLQVIIRVIFYYLISLLAVKLATRKQTIEHQLPPTLQKTFELHSTILKTVALLDIALALGGYADLILPLNLILIGLLYNLFARFTIKLLSYVSWSYILLGVVAIALNNYIGSNAWIAELYYLGITYIIMGVVLERHNHV